MRLNVDEARGRFVGSPVARLATVTESGRPHVVPIVFVVVDDVLYTSVDAKPKTTTALQRLANIAANPAVSVLVDHYSDDWTRLWWVRADGDARIAEADEDRNARRQLTVRYPIYLEQPPPGPA